MTDLITAADLERHLGATFTADQELRAAQIVTRVSGRIQRYCNRVQLTQVTDDELTLRGSYSYELALPGGPVTSVASVTVDGTAVTTYDLVGDSLVRTSIENTAPFRVPTVPHWGGTDSSSSSPTRMA